LLSFTVVSLPAFLDPGTLSARAPAGRPGQEAQEKPPLPQAEAFGAPHGIADPPAATALANVESCLATCAPLHFGQVTPVLSAPIRCSTSNLAPQSRQAYSYNGIASLP
jgi:hypothetical protein